jgi:hypothetical protein
VEARAEEVAEVVEEVEEGKTEQVSGKSHNPIATRHAQPWQN